MRKTSIQYPEPEHNPEIKGNEKNLFPMCFSLLALCKDKQISFDNTFFSLFVHFSYTSKELFYYLCITKIQSKETKSKMAKKVNRVKENPKIMQRPLKDGRIALYLEYYFGRTQEQKRDANGQPMFYQEGFKKAGQPIYIIKHDRRKKELKLYLVDKPRTPEERESNRETLLLAQKIRQKEQDALLNDVMGYRLNTYKDANIISFFETYIADYTKKDIRNVESSFNRFKTFLREYRPACATRKTAKEIEAIKQEWKDRHKGIQGHHPINENAFYRFSLKPAQLSREMVADFVDYLKDHSEGEGANTAFARFKKVIRDAVSKGILKSNPCDGLSCQRTDVLTKDILSPDEIAALISTHYEGENPVIRRAFILSLYTGIRFCDIKELRYSDIDYQNALLSFEQSKTAGHSKASRVYMPIRADLLEMIGTPEERAKSRTDRIFDLPSHTMCLKALRHWTARAGIQKHITWHCARHSFATSILDSGANVKVVAELLGHSGLKYVERYTRALDEAKKAAVNSLPTLNTEKI